MGAARLRDRVQFQRLDQAGDDLGNVTSGAWLDLNMPIRGQLKLSNGRERLESGRLESAVPGVLTVRKSSDTIAVTPTDRVVINDVPYQILAISDPDRRDRWLEVSVMRGVAT